MQRNPEGISQIWKPTSCLPKCCAVRRSLLDWVSIDRWTSSNNINSQMTALCWTYRPSLARYVGRNSVDQCRPSISAKYRPTTDAIESVDISVEARPNNGRLSVDSGSVACRSRVDRVAIDASVDVPLEVLWKIHGPSMQHSSLRNSTFNFRKCIEFWPQWYAIISSPNHLTTTPLTAKPL